MIIEGEVLHTCAKCGSHDVDLVDKTKIGYINEESIYTKKVVHEWLFECNDCGTMTKVRTESDNLDLDEDEDEDEE